MGGWKQSNLLKTGAVNSSAPKYDKSTEVKVSGVVTDVKDYDCPISGTLGAHVSIQPEQGPAIEVHVAATKYVKNYEMVFAKGDKGDKVEVLGSRVQFNGADAIIMKHILHDWDDDSATQILQVCHRALGRSRRGELSGTCPLRLPE